METKESGYLTEESCPVCNGIGCSVCNFEGSIQIGNREAPKMFVDAPEFEKDKIVTQLGKLKNELDPVARKEYSMAFVFYREMQELASLTEGEMFSKKLEEILTLLMEYRLDKVKPVEETLNFLDRLRQLVVKMNERSRLMAIHFESAIEVITRKYKEINKQCYELQNENKRLKLLLTDRISTGKTITPEEAGFEELGEEDVA